MECHSYRDQFTLRFEGELPNKELAALEQHCSSCAACAAEWERYGQSVEALRGLGARALPDSYVDGILAATLGSPSPAPPTLGVLGFLRAAPLRFAGSHVAAALLGAALVLLLPGILPKEPTPPTSQSQTGPAPESLASAPIDPPAQVLREVRYVDRVSYVDRVRYVNRTRFFPIPVSLPPATMEKLPVATPRKRDTRALQRALVFAGNAMHLVGTAFDRNSQALTTLALESETTADEPAPGRASPPMNEPGSWTASEAPVLVIQRTGDRVSLNTRGTLEEVVPALIERLGDQDPMVGELAEARLREIWSERNGAEFDSADFAGVSSGLNIEHVGWRRWFKPATTPPATESPGDRWAQWWASQELTIASAEY